MAIKLDCEAQYRLEIRIHEADHRNIVYSLSQSSEVQ